MLEDEIYRSSTQFRIWSFSQDDLNKLRSDTNATACERLRAAQQRAREARRSVTPSTTGTSTPNPTGENDAKLEAALEKDVECLTPEEELTFLRYFCEQALELGDKYKPALPTMIRVGETRKPEDQVAFFFWTA